jgi:hypothetical protein
MTLHVIKVGVTRQKNFDVVQLESELFNVRSNDVVLLFTDQV